MGRYNFERIFGFTPVDTEMEFECDENEESNHLLTCEDCGYFSEILKIDNTTIIGICDCPTAFHHQDIISGLHEWCDEAEE